MIALLFDIVGMTGTFLVVGAFFLLQLGKASPEGLLYNVMNLSGAILLLISLCYNFNLASFVIELFWIAASLIGLYKYIKSKRTLVVN
ncbi:CBU_0592 family membrane protein [Pseudoalteromonas xiamenensis]